MLLFCMTEITRKRGRPPLPADERKRAPLGFRPTLGTRQALKDAAWASGRSLSEEIEYRLHQSFITDIMKERICESVVEGLNLYFNSRGEKS